MKTIKRKDLYYMHGYESYIKECNSMIDRVFSQCIYLGKSNGINFTWNKDFKENITTDESNIIINTINAFCNTEFVFDD